MKILCPLTDWTTTTTTIGRFKGNEVRSRMVLGVDNWNWVLGLQRGDEEGIPVSEGFYGNMRLLLPDLFSKDLLSPAAFEQIVKELSKRLKRTPAWSTAPNSVAEAEASGKRLDAFFQTNYMLDYPPKVTQRLFGGKNEEEE